MVRRPLAITRAFPSNPREKVGSRARVEHDRRLDPRPPGLRDAPVEVVELARPVGVGVDRQEAAQLDRAARPLDGEVQAVAASRSSRATVPVRGGLGVDGVPVEVEVVAGADHPAGRDGR